MVQALTTRAFAPPRLIYVAGPYRASTLWDVEQNIRAAEEVGYRILQLGAMPVVPHANTRGYVDAQGDDFMLAGTLEMMRRCDGVFFMTNWLQSSGARGEHEEAMRLCIPDFYNLDHLRAALVSPLPWRRITIAREGNGMGTVVR